MSILVSAALFSSVAGQQDKLNAESLGRRDQNCIVFERISQSQAHQVAATYQYVADLSKAQLHTHFNQAVVQSIPGAERQARQSKPPAYCARPGVGLDDRKFLALPCKPHVPPPVGPDCMSRPPEVDRLLR
jgi:hypothetical protein